MSVRLLADLPSGQQALAVVDQDAILTAVDGRACLAHPRWFTAPQAKSMRDALDAFIRSESGDD